jgi:glycosyltransferase involved in cell wall biosynthesis
VTQLSIVVPCYNESRNLGTLLDRFRQVLSPQRTGVEVVLVNNGSTDDSATTLERELGKPENAFARTVHVEQNIGYGHGIVSGLRAAEGEILAWTHADLQTDPNDVLLGYDRFIQEDNPEQVFLRGRRKGRGWFDAFFTAGMSILSSWALGVALRDINAQPKMFHRSFLSLMTDPPLDFSLDLYVLYLATANHFTILEQPVYFGKRQAGEAKGGGSLRGKIKLTRRALRYIFSLKRKLHTSQAVSRL